jgi:hypothetical protein
VPPAAAQRGEGGFGSTFALIAGMRARFSEAELFLASLQRA